MAHRKSKEKLLADAKARQAARARALKKTQDLQKRIPQKIPGVPAWATGLARTPAMSEAAQLAFSQRANEAANIAALEYVLERMPAHQPKQRTDDEPYFDPNNPITKYLQDIEFPGRTRSPKPKSPRIRTDPQLVNDEIQSVALTEVNMMARKKDGSFKKGWNQKRVMRLAQKQCTRERERLGLCKRKRRRGKNTR